MSASPRQREFINKLLEERVVPEGVADEIRVLMDKPDAEPRLHISVVIDQLLEMPKKGAGAGSAGGSAAGGYWAGIEKAKYAIPRSDLPIAVHALMGGNDHLFVEVREYMERVYIRQLHGAPGSFSRSKINDRALVNEIVRVLRGSCLEYTQLFGDLYSCCGVCGAELTDETSRRLKLGPTCRGRFGL